MTAGDLYISGGRSGDGIMWPNRGGFFCVCVFFLFIKDLSLQVSLIFQIPSTCSSIVVVQLATFIFVLARLL